MPGGARRFGPRGQFLPRRIRIRPLMLFLEQLLEVRECVLIAGIQAEHFAERLEGAIDEAAALVIEPEAEENVGVLERPEIGAAQQRLVLLDRPPDLALL